MDRPIYGFYTDNCQCRGRRYFVQFSHRVAQIDLKMVFVIIQVPAAGFSVLIESLVRAQIEYIVYIFPYDLAQYDVL